jgi:ferric-dicitrate binding protein FerR (iron transport regulator)
MPDNDVDGYLWDKSGPADPDVQRLEELLAPLRHDAPLDELRLKRPRRRPLWIIAGVAVAAAAALAIFFALPGKPSSTCRGGKGFAFSGQGGDVSCGGARVANGVLPVGGQLDTGSHAASLTIADIGVAELGAHTRVRLERTDSERHQLALERGHMHAKVNAPPRLFAVTTPHTSVIDLGCEYTIDIDDAGAGSIYVRIGSVELTAPGGGLVVAPAGTRTTLLAGQRPGLPVGHSANPKVRAAVAAYEHGDPGAVDALLAAAEDKDAVTLIALAAVDDAHRATVLTRLVELSPPPDAEITVDTAMRDPDKLATWRTDIVDVYIYTWAPKI